MHKLNEKNSFILIYFIITLLCFTLSASVCMASLRRGDTPKDIPEDIRKLIDDLYTKSPEKLNRTLKKLEENSERATPAIPYLINRLKVNRLNSSNFYFFDPYYLCSPGTGYNYSPFSVLIKIGKPAVEPLLAELEYFGKDARIIHALGEIGDKRAIEPIKSVMKNDITEYMMKACVNALNSINNKKESNLQNNKKTNNNMGLLPPGDARITKSKESISALVAKLSGRNIGASMIDFSQRSLFNDLISEGSNAVEPLIDACENPESASMIAAILGHIGKVAVGELLVALNDDKIKDKRAIVSALGYIGDERTVIPLINAFNDSSYKHRSEIAHSLGKIGDIRAVMPLITALKNIGSTEKDESENSVLILRSSVISALGSIGDKRAIKPLLAILEDEYDIARNYAANALIEIGAHEAIEPIIKSVIYYSTDCRSAEEVKRTKKRYIAVQIKVLKNLDNIDKNWRITKAAQNGISFLITVLEGDDTFAQSIAARALNSIKSPRALGQLIKLLENNMTVEDSVIALGNLGDKRAVEPLIKLLKAKERPGGKYFIKETIIALGKIGDKRATNALLELLNDDYRNFRYELTGALSRIGDKQAVEPLIESLNHGNNYAKEYSIIALGKLGDKHATKHLISFLDNKENSTKEYTAKALGELGDSSAIGPLEKRFISEKNQYIRQAIKNAINKINAANDYENTKKGRR
ncbi:HEAT repeat domain-containing protein [Thermodesulfobacteriota bacterium]